MIESDLADDFGERLVLVVQRHFLAEAFFDLEFAFGTFTTVDSPKSFAAFRQFTPAASIRHAVVAAWSNHGFFDIIEGLQEAVSLAFLDVFVEGDLFLQFGLFNHDGCLRQIRIQIFGFASQQFGFCIAAFLHLLVEVFDQICEFLFDADFLFRFKSDGFHHVAILFIASDVWSLLIAPGTDGRMTAADVTGECFQRFLAQRSGFDCCQRVVKDLQSFIRICRLQLFSAEHAVHDFRSQAIILNVGLV